MYVSCFHNKIVYIVQKYWVFVRHFCTMIGGNACKLSLYYEIFVTAYMCKITWHHMKNGVDKMFYFLCKLDLKNI